MRKLLIIIFIFTTLSRAAYAEEPVESIPADVRDYLERVMLCEHFRGEPPYDEERAKFIQDQLEKFRCDSVESTDIWDLEKKYGCPGDNQRTFNCALQTETGKP